MAFSVPLSVIDIRQRRLPNRIVVPGLALTLLAQILAALINFDAVQLGKALLCAAVVFALGLGANRLGAMGMGDVKLLSLIALAFGWWSLTSLGIALASGFVLAALVVLAQLTFARRHLTSTLPLGPYLLFGCLVATTALVWS